MRALAFRSLLFVALLGCELVAAPDVDKIPASGTGGAGGAGGAGPECANATDCDTAASACESVVCDDGRCATAPLPEGTACSDGGDVCNLVGACVECLDESMCDGNDLCDPRTQTCVPIACRNGVADGDESDVDCGGACAPCDDGAACLSFSDCSSGYCPPKAGTCQPCSADPQCQPLSYCDELDGVCKEKNSEGSTCADLGQCSSAFCVDGYCCDSACEGTCSSCAEAGNEGICSPYPEGTDPESECPPDVCSGAASCRCLDGDPNGDETDTDCGGPACVKCPPGDGCSVGDDCTSEVCLGDECQEPRCGDGVMLPPELCDDGNENNQDDCPDDGLDDGTCAPAVCDDGFFHSTGTMTEEQIDCGGPCDDCPGGLVLSEIVVTGSGEYIEIYNPTAATVALGHLWLADTVDYYLVTQAAGTVAASDFRVKFPTDATLAAGATAIVSVQTTPDFEGVFGQKPDYEILDAADLMAGVDDPAVPNMTGTVGGSRGLGNTDELVIAFFWDGSSDLVADVDYLPYGNDPALLIDKTDVMVGADTYLADTAAASQSFGEEPDVAGQSLRRCSFAEGSEDFTGGNGFLGHDETSENHADTFNVESAPTPGKLCAEEVFSSAFGDASDAEVLDLTVDTSGNVIMTGYFRGTIDFGGGDLTAAGDGDIFVAKLSGTGAHLWSVSAGGTDFDEGFAVTTDAAGDVYLTGEFRSSMIDFGSTMLANTGSGDVFVARLESADGAEVWAKRFAGTGFDRGQELDVDLDGNVLVAGFFESATLDFDGVNMVTNASAGTGDVFVVELAGATGAHVWSKAFGGSDHDQAWGLFTTTNMDRDVFLAGFYKSSTINFGDAGEELSNAGDYDVFVTRLRGTDGDDVFQKSFGGTGSDQAYDLVINGAGSAIVTGTFASATINFSTMMADELTNLGDDAAFVARLSGATGAHSWSVASAGDGSDRGEAVAVDSADNVIMGGWSSSTAVNFGTTGDALAIAAGTAPLLVKLDGSDGRHLWSRTATASGTPLDRVFGVGANAARDVFAAGSFSGMTIDFFGPGAALANAGATDAFLVKLLR